MGRHHGRGKHHREDAEERDQEILRKGTTYGPDQDRSGYMEFVRTEEVTSPGEVQRDRDMERAAYRSTDLPSTGSLGEWRDGRSLDGFVMDFRGGLTYRSS